MVVAIILPQNYKYYFFLLSSRGDLELEQWSGNITLSISVHQSPLGACMNLSPITCQAADIIGGLLVTELQSHRVTESHSDRHPRVLSKRVGEVFLCLISINYPTGLARMGECNY